MQLQIDPEAAIQSPDIHHTKEATTLDGSTDIDSLPDHVPVNKLGTGFFSNVFILLDEYHISGFHPSIFINVMATGISSAILYNYSYPAHWLRVLSYIMWGVGILFFLFGSVCMVIACFKHPTKLHQLHTDPKVAPFMGCFAMGYNSLITYLYLITGKSFIVGTFVLWWISVFFSLYTACLIFYCTFMARTKSRDKKFHPSNFHTTMLLPIVALTVTSSTGQLFAMDMPRLNLKLVTIFVSFVLWANAIVLSFIVLSLCYWKYLVHKMPPTALVFTTFIPIGFLGQGSYSILLFGHNMFELITQNHKNLVDSSRLEFFSEFYNQVDSVTLGVIMGTILVYVSAFFALFMISFGYFTTLIAITTVMTKLGIFTENYDKDLCYSHPYQSSWKRWFNGLLKFNKGFWAMTFPLGTMAMANTELHTIFSGLGAFRVIGAIYGAATVIVTTGCLLGCVYHIARHLQQCVNGAR